MEILFSVRANNSRNIPSRGIMMSSRFILCLLLLLVLVQGVLAAETYTFVTKWGTQGSGNGQFDSPNSIAVDSSGNIYVADADNHRIQKFSSTGTFLTKWGTNGTGDGQFNIPWGVAVDSSGNVYVADKGSNRIQKFSSTGTFLAKWGSSGSGDVQFNNPTGVAVDSSGNVYVADQNNNRIQKFSSTGTFLTKWGSFGSGDGQFFSPHGVAMDPSGNVYISDMSNGRIQKFSSGGTFLAKFGSWGHEDGQFIYPRGIAVDLSGNVYVAGQDNRIQKFGSDGTFLASWGSQGLGNEQFSSPYGVAVDSSNNVYVADTSGNRIQTFAILVVTPAAVAPTPSVTAADTMFRANPQRTGVFDNSVIVPSNTLLWRFGPVGNILSSPAVSNGIVYVASYDDNLYAIDAVTGKQKWKFKMGSSGSTSWTRSSPAVSNGVVYVGGADGNLYAIDAVMGKEKWRFAGCTGSSPAVSNGVVYIWNNGHSFYAIDAVTGKEKWQFAGGGGSSSPAVSNGVVYVGSYDNNLYAIDAMTGKEQWRFTTGGIVNPSPAVANGVVYVGSADGNLYAIDAVTGKEQWRSGAGGSIQSSPAVSNGVVYVGSEDGNLYAIDAVTGKEQWRFATGNWAEDDWLMSSPAVANGVVYIGSLNKNLYAIDAVTGKEKWRFATGSGIRSSPALANGVIYIGDFGAALYAIGGAPSTAFSFLNTGNSNASLPIILIFVILLLTGGGYGIYRLKRKPSVNQLSRERKAITPHPSPTVSTIKPELAITLAETRLIIDKWHKVELKINNIGNAHASNIQLAFSDDFETRWVTAVSVNAGESAALSIGIKPKTEGNIPIEITASYKDGRNKDYRQVFKFWIEVAGKRGLIQAGLTPQSPVSHISPKPITPREIPPELSDRYTDFELIGKGGFARVFKATRTDGKQVALKIPISLDASTGKTFIAELQNWTKLDHPNIVRVFDYNIMPLPYFEMELCDGSLAEVQIPMDCEEAAWIVFHICEGLKYAHARSIAHRDLKPQNILLKDNIPKISDWGLSRIISKSTSTTTGSFTPYYAAPEQVTNKQKDERTDIWQMGVILYELTTGTLPFKGDSVVDVVVGISTKSYTQPSELNPNVQQIEPIISLCLQKDPDKRFQAVAALQTALGMYLRKNYAEMFRKSVSVKDIRRSAYYVGDLVIVNLIIGDLNAAYKYSTDLVVYAKGDAKVLAQELCEHLYIRIQNDVTEVPDELIKKAEFVIHKVLMGF